MNDDEKRFLEQIQKENESAHAETRRHVQALAADMKRMQTQNEAAHSETRGHVQNLAADTERVQTQNEAAHSETRRMFQTTEARFEHLHAETRQEFRATAAEMRQHFDTVAEDIAKKTHAKIQLLAESLAHVDHKVDVNGAKIDQLAADNEVFRAAFANVDRRLRVVEDIVLPQKPS
jgi:hypothetical protein